MTIYEGDTITINGEEIKINLAETKDLLQYLDDLPSWAEPEVEPVAKELCNRLGVNFDAYESYDDLYDALASINAGKGPVEYRVCVGKHECRDKTEKLEFGAADYRPHEVSVLGVYYNKDEALQELNRYSSMILDYGHYYHIEIYYIESHDLRDDYWDIEAEAEMARREDY